MGVSLGAHRTSAFRNTWQCEQNQMPRQGVPCGGLQTVQKVVDQKGYIDIAILSEWTQSKDEAVTEQVPVLLLWRCFGGQVEHSTQLPTTATSQTTQRSCPCTGICNKARQTGKPKAYHASCQLVQYHIPALLNTSSPSMRWQNVRERTKTESHLWKTGRGANRSKQCCCGGTVGQGRHTFLT